VIQVLCGIPAQRWAGIPQSAARRSRRREGSEVVRGPVLLFTA